VKIEAEAQRKSRANGFLRKTGSGLARNEALVIAAEGYTPSSATAQTIAAERHLLEIVLRRPVVVRATAGIRRPASSLRTSSHV